MTTTNFDANVKVMQDYNANVASVIGYKESVQKGDICLAFRGEKLEIVENANSIFTKIKNLFLGIRLINQDVLANNRNHLSLGIRHTSHEVLADNSNCSMFAKRAGIVPSVPQALGVKNGSLVIVEYPDSISTKIANLFKGISTNIDQVRAETKQLDAIEFRATLAENIVNGVIVAGVVFCAGAFFNAIPSLPSLGANC